MRFSQLRNLLALTEHSSLSAASQSLGIAQPVLTRSIQQLELELGVKLVERSARGTRLTEDGARLALRARKIEREMVRAHEEIEQRRGNRIGHVRIGVSPVALVLLLPKAMALFRRDYPEVRVSITDGLFPQVFDKLDAAVLDFAIGPLPGSDALTHYQTEALFTGEMGVVARAGHPLCGIGSLSGLSRANWISCGPIDGPGDILEASFSALGIEAPVPMMHCDSAISALEFVAESDLLSMLPRRLLEVSHMRHSVDLIPVREPIAHATVHMFRRKDMVPTPAAQALQAALRLCAKVF
ncbi:LysR substrate-binding domain-containing protein [Paralcaligenes ginsengisoli]